MHVAANDTEFLVFTRHVGCRKTSHLVRRTAMGDWPKHWWPRQENHKIWVTHGFDSWRHSRLRHNRHVRALYLPLGSRTLSDGAGDMGDAQYRPVFTALSGDGSFQIAHTTWTSWTRHHAKGYGTGLLRTYKRHGPFFDRIATTIRAHHPRTKCGQRYFTRYDIHLAHRPRHGGRRHFIIKRPRKWTACTH